MPAKARFFALIQGARCLGTITVATRYPVIEFTRKWRLQIAQSFVAIGHASDRAVGNSVEGVLPRRILGYFRPACGWLSTTAQDRDAAQQQCETARRRRGVDFRCRNSARRRDRSGGPAWRAIPIAANPAAANLAAVGKIEPPTGEIPPIAIAIAAKYLSRTVTIGTVGNFRFCVRGNRCDGEPQGQPRQSCRFHMQTPVPVIVLVPRIVLLATESRW